MISPDTRFDEVVGYYPNAILQELVDDEMSGIVAERRQYLDHREDQLALDLGGCLDSEL
jgi:hypothetical protein